MKKSIIATAIVTIAITIAGCSSTTTASSPTISTTPSTPTISTTPSSPTIRTSTSNGVVGFGATLDSWNTNHAADMSGNLNAGCCYNPDPKLKNSVGSGALDRYITVSVTTTGVVDGYMMNLPEGTSLNAAKVAALAEMPKDAKISFFYVQDLCSTMEVTSATLKPIFGSPDGSVDFVFWTETTPPSYNTADINRVSVSLGSGLARVKTYSC